MPQPSRPMHSNLEVLDVAKFSNKTIFLLALTLDCACAARLRLRRARAGSVQAGPRPLTGPGGVAVGGAVPSPCSAPSWAPPVVTASGASTAGGGGSARSLG